MDVRKNILVTLYIASVLFCVFTLSCFPIQSEDLFMDLALVKYFFAHGVLPTTDPFLLEPGLSMPVHHAWLSYFVFYALFWVGSYSAITLFKIFMIMAAFAIPLLAVKRNRFVYLTWGVLVVLASFMSSFRFVERTFLFSDFFTVVVLAIYLRERRSPSRWRYALPFIFALWVNMHPGFPLGWFIGFVALAIDWKRWQDKKYQELVGLTVLSVFATLINPRGLAGAIFPFVFSKDLAFLQKFNFEWMSTLNATLLPHAQTYYLVSLLALFLVLLFVCLKKMRPQWPWFEIIFFIVFASLGIWAIRFVSVLGYVLVALGCSLVSKVPEENFSIKPKYFLFFQVFLIFLFVDVGVKNVIYGYEIISNHRRVELGLDIHVVPEKAVDFIDRLNPNGEVFNTQMFGGYLAWRWGESRKIFYDGFVVSPQFFYTAYSGVGHKDDFEKVVNYYHIKVILLDRFIGVEPFLVVLGQHPEWKLAYQDDGSLVFTRK